MQLNIFFLCEDTETTSDKLELDTKQSSQRKVGEIIKLKLTEMATCQGCILASHLMTAGIASIF